MMDGIIIAGLLIVIVLQVVWRPQKDRREQETLEKLFTEMQRSFERIEKNFREDFRLNREESRLVAKDNREELAASLRAFQESFERGIASFNQLQKDYGYSELDAMLVLKDILAHEYLDNKNK